jgi:hypothetical protein
LLRRHPLTLDGLSASARFCILRCFGMASARHVRLRLTTRSDVCCACTHYLVFKEPEARPVLAVRSASPPICRFRPDLGEPSKVTSALRYCQPFSPVRTSSDAVGSIEPWGSARLHYRAGARQANLPTLRPRVHSVNTRTIHCQKVRSRPTAELTTLTRAADPGPT